MAEINSEILYFIDRTSMQDIPDLEVGLPHSSSVSALHPISPPHTISSPYTQDLSAQNLVQSNNTVQLDNNNANANTNAAKPNPPTQKDFSKIIEIIKRKIKNNNKEYNFRPYCIDGVFCYIVLYLKKKMLTIESINIKCNFTENYTVPYVLYHKKYKSIEKIVQLIYKIVTSYKILNGDLLSPTDYSDIKTEEELIPYNENEICSVCLEHTIDTTSCGHFICLSCRDKCIIQKKRDCPICRCSNVLPTYMNLMQLINNVDYSELFDLFYDKMHDRSIDDDDNDNDNNSIISSSSSSSSSSDEEEEEDDDTDAEDDAEIILEEEGQIVEESGENVIIQEEVELIQIVVENVVVENVVVENVVENVEEGQAMDEILLQRERIRNALIEVGLYDSDEDDVVNN